MENTMTMPSAAKAMDTKMPETKPAKQKEHLLVEVVGGLTVATSMVSALSLWYVFLAFVALPGVA